METFNAIHQAVVEFDASGRTDAARREAEQRTAVEVSQIRAQLNQIQAEPLAPGTAEALFAALIPGATGSDQLRAFWPVRRSYKSSCVFARAVGVGNHLVTVEAAQAALDQVEGWINDRLNGIPTPMEEQAERRVRNFLLHNFIDPNDPVN